MTPIEEYIQAIQFIRQKIEAQLSDCPEDQHMARLVLISQLQILDAVLANGTRFLASEKEK